MSPITHAKVSGKADGPDASLIRPSDWNADHVGDLDAANPRSLDVVTADLEVVNTVAETNVFTFSVPGGTLGSNNLLRLFLQFSYLNNSGANRTFTVRVKYGGTTFFTEVTGNIAASATRRGGRFEISVKGNGATNAQRGMWAPVAVSTFVTAFLFAYPGEGTSAVDSTVPQDLEVTIQHSAAAGTISFIRRWATLELMEAL